MFSNRIISRNGANARSPRPPDLSASNHFLWGCLKNKVYSEQPRWNDELKMRIRSEIPEIPRHVQRDVMENFKKRLQRSE